MRGDGRRCREEPLPLPHHPLSHCIAPPPSSPLHTTLQIKRTEGVSTTDIVGRMLMCRWGVWGDAVLGLWHGRPRLCMRAAAGSRARLLAPLAAACAAGADQPAGFVPACRCLMLPGLLVVRCSRDNARFASPADQERLTLEFSKGHDSGGGSDSGAAARAARAGTEEMGVAGNCCIPLHSGHCAAAAAGAGGAGSVGLPP